MEDKTELTEARRVKDKNAAPSQNSVESTSMDEANEVLTQSSGSQLKKNQPSSEQSQEKAKNKNAEQKNTDTSGSGSSKGTAEKDSGNKTMADQDQSPPGDDTCASPQSTSAKVLPYQEDKKKPKKSTVVNATNNKTSKKKNTKE